MRFPRKKLVFPSKVGGVLMLILATFLFIVLLSVRPIRLVDPLTAFSKNTSSLKLNTEGWKLLEMEHQKAINEIQMRIKFEDEWFHNKFMLVGGLLTGFLLFLGMAKRVNEQTIKGGEVTIYEQRLAEIFHSNAASSVLALSCVISMAIDIHIRNNMVVIQQLALWITHFVEPAYLHLASAMQPSSNFYAWEQFLRIGGGMHRDDLYGFVFYPHLHFLTWVLYILYLITLYRGIQKERDPEQNRIAFILFVLVHLTLAGLTGIAHAAPAAFEYKIVPYIDWWVTGWLAVAYFFIAWFLLIMVTLPISYRLGLGFKSKGRKNNNAGTD